jgi:hypothetical protein
MEEYIYIYVYTHIHIINILYLPLSCTFDPLDLLLRTGALRCAFQLLYMIVM